MSMTELINGNCFEYISKIPKGSIDLILTDIPYIVSTTNNFATMKDRTGRNGIDFGAWDKDFDVSQLSTLVPLLSLNGSIVLFHSFEQYGVVRKTFEGAGLVCKDKIIWQKSNPMPRNRDRRYICDCEMASWYTRRGAKWCFNRQNPIYESMVMRYPSESGGAYKRYHPTQKTLSLISYLIKIHSNEGDVVLDPFMGSGTTGVACANNNRSFIGIELCEEYYNIASERINVARSNLKRRE